MVLLLAHEQDAGVDREQVEWQQVQFKAERPRLIVPLPLAGSGCCELRPDQHHHADAHDREAEQLAGRDFMALLSCVSVLPSVLRMQSEEVEVVTNQTCHDLPEHDEHEVHEESY